MALIGRRANEEGRLAGGRAVGTSAAGGGRLPAALSLICSDSALPPPAERPHRRFEFLDLGIVHRRIAALIAARRLLALTARRVREAEVPIQPAIHIERGPLIVPADHEHGNLGGRRKADENAPLARPGEVDAADALDSLAGQPVVRRPTPATRQRGLDLFDTTPNVRPETPYVLFSDARPEDIEPDGQLVGRLWT
jgi:hypothetical protein